MKTLAFLFLASLIVLLAGLVLNEGHTRPRPRPTTFEALNGSANLIKDPPVQTRRAAPTTQVALPPLKIAPTELVLAMEGDNICKAASLQRAKSIFSVEQAPALMASIGAGASLQETFGAEGPIFGNPKPETKFKHKTSKFMHALKLAGLLHYSAGSTHLETARLLFLELEAEEPSNSAYPAFRLHTEKTLKYSAEKLAATAAQAAAGSYFDTLIMNELRSIEGTRWQSAAHHLVLTSFFDYARGINVGALDSLFPEIDRENHTRHSEYVGQLLTQGGRNASRSAYFLEFSADEYEIGRVLSGYKDLDNYALTREREGEDFVAYGPYPSEPCDRTLYDDYFAKMRGYL
jgi:hypothetical protein